MHAKENSHYQDQNTLRKTFGNISPVKGILFQMNEHSPKIKNQIPQYKPKLSGAFRSLISEMNEHSPKCLGALPIELPDPRTGNYHNYQMPCLPVKQPQTCSDSDWEIFNRPPTAGITLECLYYTIIYTLPNEI